MFRKLLIAAALVLGFAGSAAAQGNPQCPTRPAGDSTNACASTAFVNQSAGGFPGPRPWCDVRAKGAQGDGATDDTAAFIACRDTLYASSSASGGGGILFVPPGNYCVNSGVDLSTSNIPISVVGAGMGSTQVNACGHDVTAIKLGGGGSTISNLLVAGKGYASGAGPGNFAAGFTVPALVIAPNCVSCRVDHVSANGGTNAISIQAADVFILDVIAGFSYGTALVIVQHPTNPVAVHFNRAKFDTQLPSGCPVPASGTAYNPWAANTAYAVGTIVSQGGYYICAIANTGDTKSGAVFPGLNNIGFNIVDNHVTWQLVQATTYYGLDLDTNAIEIDIIASDFSNVYATAAIGTTNNLAGTVPAFIKIGSGNVISNVFGLQTIALPVGSNVLIQNSEIIGCQSATCPIINIGPSFGGNISITNNVIGGGFHGILAQSGGLTTSNNMIFSSTLGININAGVSAVSAIGDYCEATVTSTCILVNAGASDRYILQPLCASGVPACISDGGTGTKKTTFNMNTAQAFIPNLGIGLETNPQLPLVVSNNATSGITLPGQNINLQFLAGQDGVQAISGGVAYGTGIFYTQRFYSARGTAGAPTALQLGDVQGRFGFGGACGNNVWCSNTSSISGFATENQASGTNQGSKIVIGTTKNGTTTRNDNLTLDGNGHLQIGASIPSINSCSTGTVTVGSTDQAGQATATGATTCAINFATAYANAPSCVASDATRAAALQVSATTSILTVAGLTANDVFSWVCFPKVGG